MKQITEKEKQTVLDAGNAMRVQKEQLSRVEETSFKAKETVEALSRQGDQQDTALKQLFAAAEGLESALDMALDEENFEDASDAINAVDLTEIEPPETLDVFIPPVEVLLTDDNATWKEYMESVEVYAQLEHLDLNSDPYRSLLSKREQEAFAAQVRQDYYEQKAQCDVYDYTLAAFCGVVSGLVDVFLVRTPDDSVIGKASDQTVDKAVMLFAKMNGWKPKDNGNVASAIGFLERNYKVNYDARFSKDLKDPKGLLTGMSPSNHHFKSLAHSPDLVGLFFSIFDQFTNKTTVLSNKKALPLRLESSKESSFKLVGGNLVSKVIAGFFNWLGHVMSDIAGSSGTRGHPGKRGSGLSAPGFELFQFLKIGNFQMGADGNKAMMVNLSQLVTKVFESGYDARFAAATAVPVLINSLLTRLCFAVKRYFFHKLPLDECVPIDINRQPELRRMMLISYGTMCTCDFVDAAVTYAASGGTNIMGSVLKLNFIAYFRLGKVGFSELCAIYRRQNNQLDIKKLTHDIDSEWDKLYSAGLQWTPFGFNTTTTL